MKVLKDVITPTSRKWLYNVILSMIPLLVTYGVISGEEVALYIALAGAVLGISVAVSNVNKDKETVEDGTGKHREVIPADIGE